MKLKNNLPSLPSCRIASVLFLLCLLSVFSNGSRILAVFPHIGKSHQDVFQPLVDALADRGHQVVVVSFYPKISPLANYTDIHVKTDASLMFNSVPMHIFNGMDSFKDFLAITNIGLQCCEIVLSSPSVQNLLASDAQFDLVITELFQIDCFLGFVYRFQAPFIALSSSVLLPSSGDRFANPDNPSFIPNVFLTFSDRMTYYERLYNTVTTLAMKFIRRYYYDVSSERIARKYFGENMPPLSSIARNTSLVLVNSHPSLNRPRPQVPAVIDVGGMHIKDHNPLPMDIQQLLDRSKNGVIIFSMGSVLLTHTLPVEKRNIFMETFGELEQTILCKWENDTLPNKPKNVVILKWLPQRDILAHPNVVAFVSHGGLLGTSEAVFSGVPILGIPMYGDQGTNVRAIEASGAGIFLSYSQLTKTSFQQAIRSLINDEKYKKSARRLSEMYRSRPIPPLETAIFWTEHVLKFGGGDHLRVAAVSMPWYQYCLLDVLLGVLAILFIVLCIVYKLAYKLTIYIIQRNLKRNEVKKNR